MSEKIAIVVDGSLPAGLLANAIAVAAFSIGVRRPDLRGSDLLSADGMLVPGIVSIAMPVLTTSAERLHAIHTQAVALPADEGFVVIGFTEQAQRPQTYETYAATIQQTPAVKLCYRSIALYGARKKVDKLVGNLPLLKQMASSAS
ncbi:MAG: DUF2000 domain-containing protein [Pseudomonadota bacterium]|jgi:hypothetical protein